MSTDILIALAGFAFVSSITPGPNNLMLMASGVNYGFIRTVPHMLGVGIGFTVMILLVGAGLVRLFDAYPVAHTVLKVVSVAYLVWLAWKIATSAPPDVANGETAARRGAKPMTFIEAALFQWVNPKAWAMALTAVTAYATPENPLLGLLLVAGVFGAINLPCVSSWTLLGVQLRQMLTNPRTLRIFNVTMAILLVASIYPVITGGH